MADPSAARVKSPEEEDVDDEEDELRQQENDENEPHSDEDEDDLKKPSWVGYFRLPRDDVERGPVFFPNDE